MWWPHKSRWGRSNDISFHQLNIDTPRHVCGWNCCFPSPRETCFVVVPVNKPTPPSNDYWSTEENLVTGRGVKVIDHPACMRLLKILAVQTRSVKTECVCLSERGSVCGIIDCLLVFYVKTVRNSTGLGNGENTVRASSVHRSTF